ncbi:hypothetical protein AMTR_s00102p00140910 [Amborella trichopoda]|uniref:Uncharacterized protein n=1 Tax=Amborella trichopoda TaxID=13333 RepID=W1NT90_AMBTC|nr:hypothetical protein AMTR_s00102p00140910 [Amborella trichopoda]
MAQARDFFFTITEEGDIIDVEAIEGAPNDEVVILEAFVRITSQEESRPAASSSYGLALMAVAALEDKETFDPFEGLLKNLKQLGIEALQRESEIQMAYKACLASVVETLSQHQSLMRGYEEEKASILSFHASFKEAEAQSKLERLETLDSQVASISESSSHIAQAIFHLKEQMKATFESLVALKTKIREALEDF